MILQGLLSVLFGFVSFVLDLFPDIPSFPEASNAIGGVLDMIFQNLGLLTVFVRPLTITIVVPLVVILINLDKVWSIIRWVLRKIPFVGTE